MRPIVLATLAVLLATRGAAEEECTNGRDDVDPATAEFVNRGLITELIGWIAISTMYDVSATYSSPPEILFCDVGEIIAYESDDLLVDALLGAVYDRSRQQIHLVRPWSPDDPFDVSVLLHELIHDVQLNNRDWPCVGAPEFEAYWLQDKWLSEHGKRLDLSWRYVRELSECPVDIE